MATNRTRAVDKFWMQLGNLLAWGGVAATACISAYVISQLPLYLLLGSGLLLASQMLRMDALEF